MKYQKGDIISHYLNFNVYILHYNSFLYDLILDNINKNRYTRDYIESDCFSFVTSIFREEIQEIIVQKSIYESNEKP